MRIVNKKTAPPLNVKFGNDNRSGLYTNTNGMMKVGKESFMASYAVPKNVPPDILAAARQLMATGGDMVEYTAK